jgi:hypothetical protein
LILIRAHESLTNSFMGGTRPDRLAQVPTLNRNPCHDYSQHSVQVISSFNRSM